MCFSLNWPSSGEPILKKTTYYTHFFCVNHVKFSLVLVAHEDSQSRLKHFALQDYLTIKKKSDIFGGNLILSSLGTSICDGVMWLH
jgi:hypothetical protein